MKPKANTSSALNTALQTPTIYYTYHFRHYEKIFLPPSDDATQVPYSHKLQKETDFWIQLKYAFVCDTDMFTAPFKL